MDGILARFSIPINTGTLNSEGLLFLTVANLQDISQNMLEVIVVHGFGLLKYQVLCGS